MRKNTPPLPDSGVKKSSHITLLFALFGILLLVPSLARAQATGQIAGTVSDPSGRVVAAATVELISDATGQTRSTTSSSDGSFIFPLVNPGTYQVRVNATGFRTSLTRGVEVDVNGTNRIEVKLAVGPTTVEITVTDAPPLVESTNATMGVVVDRQSIVDLPLNGRNFAQLGTLIPGVVAAPAGLGGAQGNATVGGFGDTTGSFNVNGMRNQSNSFLLDGAPNNDSFNSGFVMRPPPDAIEEFKIMTHSYEAQYGRNAGSVVNVVTRSGTNQLHGDLWWFNREAALAAKTYFAVTKPNYQQNQFGAAAGGPVLKDKVFLFGYYEGFRLKDATSNVLNQPVLSSAERGGDFSELLTSSSTTCSTTGVTGGGRIIDPLTKTQFCYGGKPNVIDPARISAVSANLLKNYIPLPNSAGNFYKAAPANIDNRNMFGLRADWKLASKHSILGRYLYTHQNLYGPITPTNFPPTGNRQIMTLQDALASDTWNINDHMINVGRYAWQRIEGTPNKTSGLDLTSQGYAYSSTNATAKGLPNVTLTGYFTTGDLQQPFAYRANGVNTISDDLTWIKHRHVIQFGGEIRRDRINLLYINRPNGAFTFNTNKIFTTNALSDFLLGYPFMFQQGSGDPSLNGSSWTYSFYGQDEFRINRHLSLQAGLRYEVNRPYVEDKNHLAALHPGQQSTIQPKAPVGLVYPGDAGTPRATYYTDADNWAPRIGATIDPIGDGKTSIRAAWGLFYDTVPGQGDFFQNGTLAPPFQPLQEIDFFANTTPPTSTYFSNPYAGVAVGAPGFPPNLTFIGWSLANSFKTAQVQEYNVSVQRQLTNNMAFEVGYVGSRGEHLPIFIEVNPTTVLPSGSSAAGANAYKAGSRAVFPAFGLTRPTFSAGKSWFDSLQASWQLRNYHHIHATAAYTHGHSIDNASGLNIGTDSRPVLPATIGNQAFIDAAVARERGDSLFDARNRFVLSLQYEFPRLDGHSLAQRLIIGGWQFNTIYQIQSGSPFAVVNSSTTAQSLTFRPNQTCNANSGAPHKAGTLSSQHYINTGCFALPTVTLNGVSLIDNSHSGNAARNSALGPGYNTTDASLFKILNFSESRKFEFRFEVFNLFNEAHFSQPVATLGSSTFGQITSTVGNDSRVIQMAIKLSF
ncbi:TonB-dependent receptor [Edaphobacter bradus]|uniref:TonB-dependent receptor n=1 Tax=Edaphobacter bradus TaxID=2259016 RepID=UPI0021DF8119|nr:carboxypeptidase regulatory-like domain-containing protein [Edaphobacter bradus]